MNKPLVSICIPTYNRVDALRRCVESIIENKYYSPNIVEIVISDNCSTDGTLEYVQTIVTNKDYNIVYNRNEENIGGDLNFIKVLSIAHGEFKKLHNDYCVYTEDGLGFLIDTVRKYSQLRTLLFFSIREKEPFSYINCDNMDDFIDASGTDVSWIGSFGFWAEDFENLESKERLLETKFMQVDWALRLIKKKRNSVVCCGGLTSQIVLKTNHGDYNLVKLFTGSFPALFVPYVESKDLSPSVYENLMKRLFIMLLRWTFVLIFDKKNYSYETTGTYSLIKDCFGQYNWYYLFLIIYSVRFLIKHIAIKIRIYTLFRKLIKARHF